MKFITKVMAFFTATWASLSANYALAAADWTPIVTEATAETDSGKAAIISIGGLFVVLSIIVGIISMLKRR